MSIQKQRVFVVFICLMLTFLSLGLWQQLVIASSAMITGLVVDADGPVVGAHVRVRATENLTFTDSAGSFSLGGLIAGQVVEVTAWADGYYVASTVVTPTATGVNLTLRKAHTRDHPDYEWVSPLQGNSEKACGNCHPMIVAQWENNAHGGAISNQRFYSLYNGTNLSGTIPVAPGYQLDFPGTAGNCANCHAPGSGVDGFLTTDMNAEREVTTAGISCDFCHKVGGVYLNPASGSVYPNAPGVRSLRILRPPQGDQIFFGPYDDIPDPDTYLPLTRQSQFCAPCHQFSFWGTPIYESYNEWLASRYAEDGITCQNCHMPPTGDEYFALPEIGGLPHPPEHIPSHLQPGAADEILLQNTVTMTMDVEQIFNQVWVTLTITNIGAGHHVPTDHPGRHLILKVGAYDSQSIPLSLTIGGTIPDWGGEQAGKPGKAYAKILINTLSGEYPVVSYWKQTFIRSDNRIPALASDRSVYAFSIPADGSMVTIKAELFFRRMFQSEIDARNWQVSDITMEELTQMVSLESGRFVFLPTIKR